MESLSNNKRVHNHSDSDDPMFNSPESKKIRHDLLDMTDDSDVYTLGQDLDSVIKSFEDEIFTNSVTVDLVNSGESSPGFEFLLEASDDELGLPPTDSAVTSTELEKVPSSTESGELGLFSWLDEHVPNYDSFEYGFDYVAPDVNVNGEHVALDGLFDYTDIGFGPSDMSRWPGSLPAQ